MNQNEVFILHGPTFAGKCTFYMRELKKSHEALQPSKMFEENPSLGFRDIGLQIVRTLKEGKRMAIIDPNECRKTRLSYIKLLQKKCDSKSVAIISILPTYGRDQLFWTRELRLAAESRQCETLECSKSEIRVNDALIHKWFSKETGSQIQYTHGIVEQPCESEECEVFENSLGIYTKSVYKFEVPVLFLQWEVINGLTSNTKRLSKLAKLFELWTSTNTCGRIIVICDGSQIYTGEKSKTQQQKDIDDVMSSLTSQFTQCPVYVFHVGDPKQAGGYVIPPHPGILAFLQQRHCLNLHSRRSVYMYETPGHMKMADNAGVRHIKASRVIDHPSLVISSHAASTPAIPEMLKTKRILPGPPEPPSVPLAALKHTLTDGKIQQHFPHGRSEYLYAADDQSFQRYNDLYVQHATEVGQPGSRMSPKKRCHSTPDKSSTSQVQSPDLASNQSKLSIASRDLPKWMVKKDRSQESKSSGEVSNSSNEVPAEKKIRKTVYVMTEKELLEVACDVLKQAGKDEMVKQFMSNNLQDSHPDSNKNQQRIRSGSTKCHPRKEPGDHGNHSKTKFKTVETNSTDVGDQLGSFCPKIEPESDVEENSVTSAVNDDDAWDDKTEHDEALQDKGKNEITKPCVDIVADVLDEFSTSQVEPKPSPKKRTRIKAEPIFTTCTPSKQRCLDKADINVRGRTGFTSDNSKVHSNDHYGHSGDHLRQDSKSRRRLRHTPDLSYLDDIF